MVRRKRRENPEVTSDSGESGAINQLPFKQPVYQYAPLEIASAEDIERIHKASMKILSETGINFLWPKAREILKQAGAHTDDNSACVKFSEQFVMDKLKTAPSQFTLHARNPAHNTIIGGRHLATSIVTSTPNVSSLDHGRHSGTFKDFCDLNRLFQDLNCLHVMGGYPVEPVDLPPTTRHLDAVAASIRLTDKVIYSYALGSERIRDGIELTKLARGIDDETLLKEPSIFTIVNSNSPLQYDIPMLRGATEMSKNNQPVIYTPFTLAGAMAPITVAGALVQQNAEALAGIVYSQCVRPGAPVVYGTFTSNVDMRSGSPAFGTPEYTKATLISGQLARRYNLPSRASNANASCAADAQAVYESQMSLWACIMGQINYIHHAAGWIEGGLCTSFEKVIIDAEMLQMLYAMLEPISFSEDDLAVDAIATVGAGQHYFQSPHTMARYTTAFYQPFLADWRNFETWTESGSVEATQRANSIYKEMLQHYKAPALDPKIDAAIEAYVNKRKAEGGAPV